MSTEHVHAETQYGDLTGSVSIDGWSSPPMHEMAKAIGVDTDRYWPINVSFYASPPVGSTPYVTVTVDAVDKLVAGTDFDAIQAYVRGKSGVVPTVRFFKEGVDLSSMLSCVKRLSIVVRRAEMEIRELKPVETEVDLTAPKHRQ